MRNCREWRTPFRTVSYTHLPLEESFQIYKEGMELLKECSARIDTVEKKMLQINSDGEISEF